MGEELLEDATVAEYESTGLADVTMRDITITAIVSQREFCGYHILKPTASVVGGKGDGDGDGDGDGGDVDSAAGVLAGM